MYPLRLLVHWTSHQRPLDALAARASEPVIEPNHRGPVRVLAPNFRAHPPPMQARAVPPAKTMRDLRQSFGFRFLCLWDVRLLGPRGRRRVRIVGDRLGLPGQIRRLAKCRVLSLLRAVDIGAREPKVVAALRAHRLLAFGVLELQAESVLLLEHVFFLFSCGKVRFL